MTWEREKKAPEVILDIFLHKTDVFFLLRNFDYSKWLYRTERKGYVKISSHDKICKLIHKMYRTINASFQILWPKWPSEISFRFGFWFHFLSFQGCSLVCAKFHLFLRILGWQRKKIRNLQKLWETLLK